MTYDIYRYIFIGGAILAGLMIILSAILFFALKIPQVFGDLTGRTARKAIENIRNQNESSGEKVYKTSLVNRERGKITDKISPSGTILHTPTDILGGAMATEKISTKELPPDEIMAQTTVLVNGVSGETSVLTADEYSGETTILSEISDDSTFTIEYDITFIHTDEIIATEAIK